MRLLRWAVLLCRLVRAPSLGTGPELLPREWHTLAPSPPSASGAYPLRVAQFNILADGLAGKHPQLGGFTDTPAGALEWEVRRARVCVAMRAGGLRPRARARAREPVTTISIYAPNPRVLKPWCLDDKTMDYQIPRLLSLRAFAMAPVARAESPNPFAPLT